MESETKNNNNNNSISLFWFSYPGYHAERVEGWGSQSTASVTSTWYWWQTWQVQGISSAYSSKEPTPSGCPWAGTGDKTGNPILFLWARLSLLESQAVTVAPQPPITSLHRIGSSDRPSRAKISGFNWKYNKRNQNPSFSSLSLIVSSNSRLRIFLFFLGKIWRKGW